MVDNSLCRYNAATITASMDSTVTADPVVLFVHVVRMNSAPRTSTATSTFRPVGKASGGVTPTTSVAMETSAREGSARSESAEDIGTVLVTRPVIIRASAGTTKLIATRDIPDTARMDMSVLQVSLRISILVSDISISI